MFVPCDRKLHVSGHVLDIQHQPISNATIELYGVKQQTDDNGCFYFGGLLAASGFYVSASNPGYRSYREGKEFDFYDIEITLASIDSPQPSSAVWHRLAVGDLSKF